MWSFDAAFHVSIDVTCGCVLGQPTEHVGLQQQPEPVAAVVAQHGGVVLLGELRTLAVDGDHGVAGQLAGLPVPREDPVQPVAPLELGVLVGPHPLAR